MEKVVPDPGVEDLEHLRSQAVPEGVRPEGPPRDREEPESRPDEEKNLGVSHRLNLTYYGSRLPRWREPLRPARLKTVILLRSFFFYC